MNWEWTKNCHLSEKKIEQSLAVFALTIMAFYFCLLEQIIVQMIKITESDYKYGTNDWNNKSYNGALAVNLFGFCEKQKLLLSRKMVSNYHNREKGFLCEMFSLSIL